MTTLARLPLTKKIRDVHREVLGEKFPVGVTFAPRIEVAGQVGAQLVDPPYVVLIPLDASYSGPPFTAPDADVSWPYQVTMVAKTGLTLEWMRDKVVDLWLGRTAGGVFLHPFTVDGQYVMDRRPSDDTGSEPLGGDQGAITVSTTLRFTVDVTPYAVPVP